MSLRFSESLVVIVLREAVAIGQGKEEEEDEEGLVSFFSTLRVSRVYGWVYTVTQSPIESLVISGLEKKRRADIAPEHCREVYCGGKRVKMQRARIVCKVEVIVEEYLRERSFRVFAEDGGIISWRILDGVGEIIFEPVQRDEGRDGVQILALMIWEAR